MDWDDNARELHERVEQHSQLQMHLRRMRPEDADWVKRHLDLAFEGREDYLQGPLVDIYKNNVRAQLRDGVKKRWT